MVNDRSFSWSSALVGAGAATAAATAIAISSKARQPAGSHLISIDLTSFKLNFPTLDARVNLTVHVTNPSDVAKQAQPPPRYADTGAMSISSSGLRLGSTAPVEQQLISVPVRLSGNQLAHMAKKFVAEVGRRKMELNSTLNVSGAAKVMWWNQKFKLHVDSHVIMDPLSLHLLDQQNSPNNFKVVVKS